MAALLRHGLARRIGGSMLHPTQEAVEEEQRRLVTRRLYCTENHKRTAWMTDKELEEHVRRLKPHQLCWEVMNVIPLRKFITLVVGTTALVAYAAAGIEVSKNEKKLKQAGKMLQQ